MKKIKKYVPVLYWAIVVALLGLYFTNDFGLVDIHKTSFIVAVGVDTEEDEVQVTAQIAVPQPSTSGDSINYIEVQGSGFTIADALNEINAKTGTYPQLLFCQLILIGDSCKDKELFQVLGCFYRRNYSELTALVAMCEGKASDMLAKPASIAPENSEGLQKVLSHELEKSGNVTKANLKTIAEANFSESKACYMPYIQMNKPGTSQNGGGDRIGGDDVEQSQSTASGSGQSNGGQGGASAQSGGGQDEPVEFTARKTAIFSEGKFAGILDETQSFALNMLETSVDMAIIPCTVGETEYTIGLKGISGKADFKVEKGVPKLTVTFKANAQVQGAKKVLEPHSVVNDDVVKKEVLDGAEKELKTRFENLIEISRKTGCDMLGIKKQLHKYYYKYYDAFKDDVLNRMEISYKIEVISKK